MQTDLLESTVTPISRILTVYFIRSIKNGTLEIYNELSRTFLDNIRHYEYNIHIKFR